MQPVRRAIIDVGTNSVKLLVADVEDHQVYPIHEEARQTRLGQGFYRTHQLQPDPILRTAEAVALFAQIAHSKGAPGPKVIATSAARDALNSQDLLLAIHRKSGLETEVISGEQEADWGFQGITTDPELAQVPVLAMDTGGGSTQFVLGRGTQRHFARSCRLGTVRLLETLPHGNPPTVADLKLCRDWVISFLTMEVREALSAAIEQECSRATSRCAVQLVGTGGTASVLACMEAKLDRFDRATLERTRVFHQKMTWHVEHLWSLSLEQRQQIVGLPPNKADVILAGAVIYESVMRLFAFGELRVSTRGLRFAALLDASDGSKRQGHAPTPK